MGDDDLRVSLTVINDNLRLAIERLSRLHPLVLHGAAWRAFNIERENREAGHPASWIQLAKKHVDALPEAIRELFDEK